MIFFFFKFAVEVFNSVGLEELDGDIIPILVSLVHSEGWKLHSENTFA